MNLDDEGGECMNVYILPFEVVRTSFIALVMRFGGGIVGFKRISVNTGAVDVLLTLYKDWLSSDSNKRGPEGGILLLGLW